MWNNLAEWLNQQLTDRNLSAKAASKQAGLAHSAISKFMRGTQPNVESCRKLAQFFGVSERLVLELAGYFPPENADHFVREVSHLAGRVPEDQRQVVLAFLRTVVEIEQRRASEPEVVDSS